MPCATLLALALLAADDPRPPSPQDVVAALETAVADAIARAEPSVVAIARWRSADGRTTAVRDVAKPRRGNPLLPQNFDPNDPSLVSYDYASGVVIGERGEILTAYHAIKGAARILVRASGVGQFEAEILAADPRTDLAVIGPMVGGDVGVRLKPAVLGDAATLRKGAFLVALGNPFNAARDDGRASASWGILANLTRKMNLPPGDGASPIVRNFRHFPTLLQLDAKLNLGMSGGAVINLKGEIVGLTTATSDSPGFDSQAGYAIPMDALGRRVVEALRQGKEAEYGFIGISLSEAAPNQVGAVRPGTPAEEAGLKVNDQIIGVGDVPVEEVEGGLNLALSTATVGRPVTLRIRREGQVLERTVLLSKYPVEGEVIACNRPGPWRGLRVDFSSMLGASTFDNQILQAMAKGGVGIVEVVPGSAAEAAGLKRGQIVTKVDGKPLRTPADFYRAVADREGPVRILTEMGEVTLR